MIVFEVFASRHKVEEKQSPVIWSVDAIIKMIPNCPNNVAKQILKQTEPKQIKQKIEEVKRSLQSFAKTAGNEYYGPFTALNNDMVAEMYVKDTKRWTCKFTELSKAAGTWNALMLLEIIKWLKCL